MLHALCHTLCTLRPVVRARSTWGKGHHPQVILNKKLQQIVVCAFSELNAGEQEWKAFATVMLSPLHNLPGTMNNIVCISQYNIPSTWKLSEKMDPAGVNSTYTTNYLLQYSWDLTAMLGSRKDPEFLMKCPFLFGWGLREDIKWYAEWMKAKFWVLGVIWSNNRNIIVVYVIFNRPCNFNPRYPKKFLWLSTMLLNSGKTGRSNILRIIGNIQKNYHHTPFEACLVGFWWLIEIPM